MLPALKQFYRTNPAQNIISQRINHRLPEWKQFCEVFYRILPNHISKWLYPEGHTPE